MSNNNLTTEMQILASAEKLFLANGFKATSTTDIAKDAGCNQTLVHYYYRTKEKLFEKVFEAKFAQLFKLIKEPLDKDCEFFNKLECIVNGYFDIMSENPQMPVFILNEVILNEGRRQSVKEAFMRNHFREEAYARYSSTVREAQRKGLIREVEPIDLLLDIVSLTIYSFTLAPVYIDFLDLDDRATKDFLARRKKEVLTLLKKGLQL